MWIKSFIIKGGYHFLKDGKVKGIYMPNQKHTAKVLFAEKVKFRKVGDTFVSEPECDGLITSALPVGVKVADCVPILLKGERFYGAIHAGWRGTVDCIAKSALSLMVELGENSSEIKVSMGPSIGPCCFEVDKNVALKFKNLGYNITERGGKLFVDLKKILAEQFKSSEVREENIEIFWVCTFCSGLPLASWRRDKKGSQISVCEGGEKKKLCLEEK